MVETIGRDSILQTAWLYRKVGHNITNCLALQESVATSWMDANGIFYTHYNYYYYYYYPWCSTLISCLSSHAHPLCSAVFILKPNVGEIVVISSPVNFLRIVVLPALSSPL